MFACRLRGTPRNVSGGFVWYPYSVSQIGLGPNSRLTRMRSFRIVAIVIHGQPLQPPLDGVSIGNAGYGWWA